MQVSTETFGNVLVAHTPEEFTEDFADSFFEALTDPIHDGQTRSVLQLDRTDAFDSAGLTGLVDFQNNLRNLGGNVVISGLRDPGRKIFEVTRLDRQFEIYESVIDAVSRLQD